MASPLGHALAGLAVARAAGGPRSGQLSPWVLAGVCAGLAISPDFDFLPGVLEGRPAAYHQGLSHSLVAAAAVGGLAAWLVARERAGAMRLWPVFSLAYATHLALDLLGVDTRPPYGMPLLWPFTSEPFLAPMSVLPGIDHAARADVGNGEWVSSIFTIRNLLAILVELAVMLPLLAGAQWWARRRAQPEPC